MSRSGRNKKLSTLRLLALAGSLIAFHSAHAHISYNGRDLGSYSGQTNATRSITNQTVTGNFGWADAADGILGDSHKGRAFRFHLDNPAQVTLTVSANPGATATALGDLTPAFSIYSGLAGIAPFPPSQTTNAPSADHDFGDASIAWRIWWVQQNLDPNATTEAPTDGSWNALGHWQIGGDGDLPGDFAQLSRFLYQGSAASTNSGGSIAGTFALPAGDYTVFVGGNQIADKTSDLAARARGLSVTLDVAPPPALTIAEKVFVAWPAGLGARWILQSASDLDPGQWTVVTNPPVVVDSQTGVVLEKSAARRFFRFQPAP